MKAEVEKPESATRWLVHKYLQNLSETCSPWNLSTTSLTKNVYNWNNQLFSSWSQTLLTLVIKN